MKSEMRNSTPKENIEKLKQVLLYILRKAGNKPNFNKIVLFHLLYFIDLDYYEKYEEQIMGLKYMKTPVGPVPFGFEKTRETLS